MNANALCVIAEKSRVMPGTRALVRLGIILGLGACVEAEGTGDTLPVVRDSAGISIVDYSNIDWDDRSSFAALQLIESVAFEYDFYRVIGMVRLSSGATVVGNAGSGELLWFDRNGRHYRSSGREGDGPGEFRSLTALLVFASDSLLTYDSRLRRFQVFDSSGAYLRSYSLAGPGSGPTSPQPLSVTHNGHLVIRDLRSADGSEEPGVRRLTHDILLYDQQGRFLDSLVSAPAWEAYTAAPVNGVALSPLAIPWGNNTVLAANHKEIVLAENEVGHIRSIGVDGKVQRHFRGPARSQLPVTSADLDAYVQNVLAHAPPPAASQLMAAYAEMPVPENKPRLKSVRAGVNGELWILDWPAAPDDSTRALLLTPEWRIAGAVALPARVNLHAVLDGAVLCVVTDGNGVEHVREYRVVGS